MTMHINFIQRECTLCGRFVSRPNYGRHFDACKRKRMAAEGVTPEDMAVDPADLATMRGTDR